MNVMKIREQLALKPEEKTVYQQIFLEITFAKKEQKCILFSGSSSDVCSRFFPLSLAAAIAEEGKRIVVINGNTQRSSLENSTADQGLAPYLSGHCSLDNVIVKTDIPQVDLIPVGRASMNPILLENYDGLEKIFSKCKNEYDWILINTAPLAENNMSAVQFAPFCDGAVLLAKDHATYKKWLENAKKVFEEAGCSIEGCVVLDVKKSKSYSKEG